MDITIVEIQPAGEFGGHIFEYEQNNDLFKCVNDGCGIYEIVARRNAREQGIGEITPCPAAAAPADDPVLAGMVSALGGHLETVATFEQDGVTYEIDHLGTGEWKPTQWGQFAVYRDGRQVTDFAIEESLLRPEHRPAELPVTTEQLVDLARRAVADAVE